MSKRKASYDLPAPAAKKLSRELMTRELMLRQGGGPQLRRQGAFRKKSNKNNSNVVTLLSYPMPQKARTQLRFLEYAGLISALTSSHSLVWRPTSYFDANPVVGGGTFSGYTFFASMYGRYRVTSFKYKVTFVNLEASAVAVSCQAIAAPTTPTTGTATDFTEAASENDYGQFKVCAPASSTPEQILTGYVDCVKLWGTPEAKTAEGWASQVGTSPGANSWLRIAAHKGDGTALALGVQAVVEFVSYGYWDQRVSDVVS